MLDTAATTARASRLAGLDADAGAQAVGALMAERLLEGEPAGCVIVATYRRVTADETSSMCSIMGLSRVGWRYRAVQTYAFGGELLVVRRGEVVQGLHAIACIRRSMHESQRCWAQVGE